MIPLIIIQCRFSSTRLPGKVLYPLNGLPILVFLIRRIKMANIILENENEFSCHYISPSKELARGDIKVTIDTYDDWQRMTRLLKSDLSSATSISLIDAIKRFDNITF